MHSGEKIMFKNLVEMIYYSANRFGNQGAFATRNKSKKFDSVTYSELLEMSENLALALIEIGVQAREHVGIIADNRVEWIVSDIAIQMTGAADVPRGTDVTDNDILYILPHADVKVLFVENNQTLEKVLKLKNKLGLTKIILMDKDAKLSEGIVNIYDLIERGKILRKTKFYLLQERIQGIKEEDLFTLIYTSGTTGAPKGVMLTHKNMVFQINHLPISLSHSERILSILPVWHIFERVFEMIAIATGSCTYYTNIRNLKEDLQIVKPTFMASAPRLWESIYQGIMGNLDKAPKSKKNLFNLAYTVSRVYHDSLRFLLKQKIQLEPSNHLFYFFMSIYHLSVLFMLFIPNLILDKIVLSKIRQATGGQLRGSVSGGGALPTHIDEFFNNIGIPVLEGYGMTETAPIISVRTFQNLIIGTVGKVFPQTSIRILDINSGKEIFPANKGYAIKGEIHVKGDQVMRGYYKNPEATSKVLKDGWMNTGDLGVMTYNGCLKIVGRSKETIVLLSGENVEPVPIEHRLLHSEFIDQCMVIGQDKKFLGALIVPNLDRFKEYGQDYKSIAENKYVYQKLSEEIKKAISAENGFKSFEKVLDFRLLPKQFEVGDELTAKLSVKRHVIAEKYQHLIDSIYK